MHTIRLHKGIVLKLKYQVSSKNAKRCEYRDFENFLVDIKFLKKRDRREGSSDKEK